MSARLLFAPVLLALLAVPGFGQGADEVFCSNRNNRLPPGQVMAACERLAADTSQTRPWRAKAFAWRGNAHNRTGNRTAALADFDQALALDDDNLEARFGRAQLRYSDRNYAGALADLDKVVEIEPDYGMAHILRSNTYLHLKRYDEAISEADNIRLAGGFAVLSQRCRTRAVAGVELDKARLACSQALWIQPEAIPALESRALVALKQKRFQAAWDDFHAVARRAPKNAHAVYGRGLAAIGLGRNAEGEADIAAAKTLAPDFTALTADMGLTQ